MKTLEQQVHELQIKVEEQQKTIASMQAQIDSLMLEHCPGEMPQEQLDNWAKHQVPADPQPIIDLCSSRG